VVQWRKRNPKEEYHAHLQKVLGNFDRWAEGEDLSHVDGLDMRRSEKSKEYKERKAARDRGEHQEPVKKKQLLGMSRQPKSIPKATTHVRVLNKRAKGLTAYQILQNANRKYRRDTKDVSIGGSRTIKLKGEEAVQFKTLTTARTVGGATRDRPHTVTIIPTDVKGGVILDCDCEDFVFGGCEYSLAWHGAAYIRRGNGKAPVVNFPNWKRDYIACKHCLRALIEYKKKYL